MVKGSKFKLGDKVVLTEDHINSSGQKTKKGTKGTISFKTYSIGMREWAYDVDVFRKENTYDLSPHDVPEYSLKKRN